jgi:hypothetical protein
MINRMLRVLWPKITTAVIKEAMMQIKPMLIEMFDDVRAAMLRRAGSRGQQG